MLNAGNHQQVFHLYNTTSNIWSQLTTSNTKMKVNFYNYNFHRCRNHRHNSKSNCSTGTHVLVEQNWRKKKHASQRMHYDLCDYQKCQRPAARTWYLSTWKMGEHDCATNGLPLVTKTKLLASLNRLPESKFNCSIRVQTHQVQIYQLRNGYPFMYTNSLPVIKLLKNMADQDIFV
jgi:hypothetical protein